MTPEQLQQFDQAIDAWRGPTQKKVYAADRRDLRRVRNLCAKGDLSQAAQLAWDLDTLVRDQIPDIVWDELTLYME